MSAAAYTASKTVSRASWLDTNISATNSTTPAASCSAPSAATSANCRRSPPGRWVAIHSPASTVTIASGATIASVSHAPWAS